MFLKKTFLAFCLFFCLKSLHATHIVGGEITYRCLGNNVYEITLQVFRDCYTGVPWFDNPSWVAVYDRDWNLVKSMQMQYSGQTDTLPITLSNPCLTVPPDVCVNTTTFRQNITLPFKPGGYTLVYQRCCRNQLIRNIWYPLATGASFTAQISEKALQECNNSAVFKQWPPVAICVHQPIDFDHSATDPDGDKLVYKLCTPLIGADTIDPQPMPPGPGPYPEVNWINPPYNLSNVLGGDPLTIDPNTGFLTGIPNTIGNFVVGICVEEWRDGVLISTTRRDFQYNVADCGEPTAAFFSPEISCDTRKIKFENLSSAAALYRWYFDYPQNLSATSVGVSPSYTYPDTGFYTIALVAVGSSNACRDTFFRTIHITDRHLSADFKFDFPDCDSTLTVSVSDLSTDDITGLKDWEWSLGGPNGFLLNSTDKNPVFEIHDDGLYSLTLIATAGNGCMDTLSKKFAAPFPKLDNLQAEFEICPGDSVFLNPNPNPNFSYSWSPPNNLDNPSAPNPLAKPTETIGYQVVATHSLSGCTTQKAVTVEVLNPASLSISATPEKILLGESSQLEVLIPGASNIVWTPPSTLSNPNIPNPIATPTDTTLYTATALLSSGCEIKASVLVIVLTPDCAEPYVFFPNAFSPNGDSQNDVLKLEGRFVETVNWVIYDRWGEKIFEADTLDDAWDGTFKGKDMPAETYGFYLHVTCPNGTELTKKGNITLLR